MGQGDGWVGVCNVCNRKSERLLPKAGTARVAKLATPREDRGRGRVRKGSQRARCVEERGWGARTEGWLRLRECLRGKRLCMRKLERGNKAKG
eukprot:691800-Pleurochrysis_carterae.AAC.1